MTPWCKTGRKPKDDIILNGGNELQRCLYAFAVKAMLGNDARHFSICGTRPICVSTILKPPSAILPAI
jgi:hypothetical protein